MMSRQAICDQINDEIVNHELMERTPARKQHCYLITSSACDFSTVKGMHCPASRHLPSSALGASSLPLPRAGFPHDLPSGFSAADRSQFHRSALATP
jgi:hypothetical protein